MIIIPARLQSTRFKEKIIHNIAGIPMIVRVAKRALEVDEVIVAADDEKIIEICKAHKIHAILTSKHHLSGSDRIAQAIDILHLENEMIINVQGDEPFIEPEVISELKDYLCTQEDIMIASAYRIITHEEAKDPNLVKVILDYHSHALYFSRSIIPYTRDHIKESYYGHLGIYGYKPGFLKTFCSLHQAPIEQQEKLEQLRALYYGYPIGMIEVHSQSFGIDTEEDLNKALKFFASQL